MNTATKQNFNNILKALETFNVNQAEERKSFIEEFEAWIVEQPMAMQLTVQRAVSKGWGVYGFGNGSVTLAYGQKEMDVTENGEYRIR